MRVQHVAPRCTPGAGGPCAGHRKGASLMDPMRVEVVPRRGLSRQEAARYVGISVTLFDELVAEGVMPQPFTIRSRKLWDIRALDAAIDALADVDAADKAERERWTRVVA
jgi:predicted DNA-binding transcriptional regulator AlpA